MPSVCFVDNDVILKLVACNLFWESINVLGLSPSDVRVRATTKYYFQKKPKKYPQTVRDQAIAIIEKCQLIDDPPINEELQTLQQIEGIDPGEGVLIAATQTEASFYLVTGDKNCLRALANAPELDKIRQRLKGRVVCLEQLILRLVETQAFDGILTKVLPGRQYDAALKAVFGSGEKATKENVLLALRGYVDNLRSETEELLVDIQSSEF
ncbi:MAG: hypothetical protein F6J92_35855 [Symploca sp. SIO1A3]|nr:hypothetical protein [Symploca sp. SIO1A3]